MMRGSAARSLKPARAAPAGPASDLPAGHGWFSAALSKRTSPRTSSVPGPRLACAAVTNLSRTVSETDASDLTSLLTSFDSENASDPPPALPPFHSGSAGEAADASAAAGAPLAPARGTRRVQLVRVEGRGVFD